ncbi:MAG: hypothetical protein JXB13_12125 [Phycisphaerae bacterium]|nr:hypothetical protein [Phycisphaerae bacterium]
MRGSRCEHAASSTLWTSVLLTYCALLGGCGGGSGTPGAGSGDTGNDPLFSGEVIQTLRGARDDFRAKLTSMDFDAARNEILEELGDKYANVVSVSLAADATTILMEMEDGSLAALDTTDFSELWEGIDSQTATRARTMPAIPADGAADSGKLPTTSWRPDPRAADILIPTSRKALLITAAGITDPIAVETVEQARDTLFEHGWTSNDVDLLARTEAGTAITPEDFFNLGSYGLIILVGHGGWSYFDGVPLHYFQCCSNVDYSGLVGDAQQAKYEQWKDDGKMIIFTYADPGLGADAEDIYLRSDLLEEQVGPLPASHVHMLSCFSLAAYHAFTTNNSGDYWGWNHKGPAAQGERLIVDVLKGLLEDEPKTNVEVATALDDERSFFYGDIESRLTLRYWIDYRFYLPGWAHVTVDGDAPATAKDVWIELAYTDPLQAGLNVKERLSGTTHDFGDVIPAEARFKITAIDASGKTVASGQDTVLLHAGLNELNLDFCTAQAAFSVSEYPEAGVTVDSVSVQAVHSDPTVDPIPSFTMDPAGTETIEDLLVGELAVTSEARDTGGELLGISEQTFGLDCDENDLEICFGWVKVQSSELPLYTDKVTVETSFTDAVLEVPDPVEYASGASATIVGFRVGSEVTFTATAENAVGQELGTETVTHVMTCGENEVTIDFFDYAIILSASPSKVDANGFSTSVITATLKKMTEEDLLVPTGDPVSGESVEFDTTLGTFVTSNPVVTGADGVATIGLVSSAEGTAIVRAFVEEDLVESGTVEVEFTGEDAPGPAPSDTVTVELSPERMTLCMNENLTISALVSAPPDATIEYSWSAPMWADRGGTAEFWPLYDSSGNKLGPDTTETTVAFFAKIYHEYSGVVQVTVKAYDADGAYQGGDRGECSLDVEVCGDEIPVTIEVVVAESGGKYCGCPRAVFIWDKVPGVTRYLLALHPNKDDYDYGDGHYGNRGFVINTVGNIQDVGDDQAGYIIAYWPCSEWQDEPPDASAFSEILEDYEEKYGSYTAAVQPLYD